VKTAKTKSKSQEPKSDARNKTARAKLALVERCHALGLIEQHSVERLEKLAETVGQGTDGPAKAVAWDRELYATLVAFEAQGGDGASKRNLPSLIAFAEGLSHLPDSRDGLTQALAALKKTIPLHGASLYVRNPDRKQVELTAVCGFEVELVPRIRFAEGNGFSSWVATRKKPVLYSSIHRNEAPGSGHVRSFMATPLVVGGNTVGVLNVGHRDENAYDPPMLRRLLLAAGPLSALVQRFVANQQIESREIKNPVTQLATPVYFRTRLDEEVVRCRELGHAMSLLRLKLSELGPLGDQFGAEFKERSLADLARLIGEWKSPTELVGHDSGDTLLALLPAVRGDRGQERAEALAALVQKHNFPRRKRMTLGWGLATYPADAESAQELLACVDKALNEASRPRGGYEGVSQLMVA
jgi:GGDEF domain-containing protein